MSLPVWRCVCVSCPCVKTKHGASNRNKKKKHPIAGPSLCIDTYDFNFAPDDILRFEIAGLVVNFVGHIAWSWLSISKRSATATVELHPPHDSVPPFGRRESLKHAETCARTGVWTHGVAALLPALYFQRRAVWRRRPEEWRRRPFRETLSLGSGWSSLDLKGGIDSTGDAGSLAGEDAPRSRGVLNFIPFSDYSRTNRLNKDATFLLRHRLLWFYLDWNKCLFLVHVFSTDVPFHLYFLLFKLEMIVM